MKLDVESKPVQLIKFEEMFKEKTVLKKENRSSLRAP